MNQERLVLVEILDERKQRMGMGVGRGETALLAERPDWIAEDTKVLFLILQDVFTVTTSVR
jgi:hypothetical protein